MLNYRNCNLGYANKTIINQFSTEFQEGKITGIVGRNGSGKSTIIKALYETEIVRMGNVLYRGEEQMMNNKFAKEVVMLSQVNSFAAHLTVEKYLSLTRFKEKGLFNLKTSDNQHGIEFAIKICKIEKLLTQTLGELSGGQRQRVFLAFALAQKPKMILLDEPATYLDINAQIDLMKIIRQINQEYQITVVVVHHDLEQVLNFCDQLIVLEDGKMIVDQAINKIKNFDFLTRVFAINAEVSQTKHGYQINYNYQDIG